MLPSSDPLLHRCLSNLHLMTPSCRIKGCDEYKVPLRRACPPQWLGARPQLRQRLRVGGETAVCGAGEGRTLTPPSRGFWEGHSGHSGTGHFPGPESLIFKSAGVCYAPYRNVTAYVREVLNMGFHLLEKLLYIYKYMFIYHIHKTVIMFYCI